jgi:hypothetical protein
MPMLAVNGAELYYEVRGDGPPVRRARRAHARHAHVIHRSPARTRANDTAASPADKRGRAVKQPYHVGRQRGFSISATHPRLSG